MDLRQLKYFLRVAELSSFRAASESLNISQPALGAQVRKLEEELDVQLFTRHSRGVEATDAGRRLEEHARALLERSELAIRDVRRLSGAAGGVVKIGVTPSIGRALAPELLEACADRHPDIEVNLTQGFSHELDRALLSSRLDMSFSTNEINDEKYESLPLLLQKTYVVGTPEALSGLETPIPLNMLQDLPLAMDARDKDRAHFLQDLATRKGVHLRNIRPPIHSMSIRRETVLTGNCSTIVPYALFAQEISQGLFRALEIDEPSLDKVLNLNTRTVETMMPAENVIRQLVVELVDKHIAQSDFGWTLP
tara:strand:- start:668 stop:1594 length:927 start_codon:yes stop_codon:yes gene_type:complete